MDPNATLAQMLDDARRILDDEADTYPDNIGQDAVSLAEGVVALHGWLAGRGFLPAAWGTMR